VRRRAICVAGAALLAVPVRTATAQATCPARSLAAELFGGTGWSLPLPLTLDGPDGRTRFRARYSTRPFADSPYYSYRLGVGGRDGSIEAEMLHHKLYLENPVPPIDGLEITHGYNLPTINVAGPGDGWQLRVGLGIVVAHPEGRVAGRPVDASRSFLGGGYQIAGITTQVALGRRYALGRGRVAPTVAPEMKLTGSWASMRFGEGRLMVPNLALHVLGGLGVRRCG
jgi:hypothetical protein